MATRAMLRRLNRKLAHDGRRVRKSRRGDFTVCGCFYMVDVASGRVLSSDLDAEALASRLGVIPRSLLIERFGDRARKAALEHINEPPDYDARPDTWDSEEVSPCR